MRFLFLLVAATLLKAAESTICPQCGDIEVPYPLSTGTSCGQQSYKLMCDVKQGVLLFPAVSGNYSILSIDGASRTIILDSRGLLPNTCISPELATDGLNIGDGGSPFHLTIANMIMLFNCSQNLLNSPLNCTSSSPCHRYINEVVSPRVPLPADDQDRLGPFSTWKECANPPDYICCSFPGVGRPDSRTLALRSNQCSSYVSVVNINESLSPSYWSYGLQLQWNEPPLQPCTEGRQDECGSFAECVRDDQSSSSTFSSFVCMCSTGFIWASVNGTCVPGNTRRDETAFIAGLSSAFTALMAGAIATSILYRRRQARKKAEWMRIRELSEMLTVGSGGRCAQVFSGREMMRATNRFAADRVLGSGGFGEVYMGKLDDGTVVAVKTAKVGNTKGTEQVINEVRILSQVNHRSLVHLLGCCVDMEQPLLVYEYVPNGTLLDHLSGLRGSGLDWTRRLHIALQTAQALAYLHSAAQPPIYHRDVKSSNILLDEDLNVKVSDFGLSRLASLDVTHISTCAQGTIGYLDPEYYRNYQLTDKSDVYSFGVVLLELVTSQRAIDFGRDPDDVNLAICAFTKQEKGRLLDVADPGLKDTTWPTTLDTILATALLALSCLQPTRQDRPPMKEVAEELQVIIEIEESGEKVVPHNLHKLAAWTMTDLGDDGHALFKDLQQTRNNKSEHFLNQQNPTAGDQERLAVEEQQNSDFSHNSDHSVDNSWDSSLNHCHCHISADCDQCAKNVANLNDKF